MTRPTLDIDLAVQQYRSNWSLKRIAKSQGVSHAVVAEQLRKKLGWLKGKGNPKFAKGSRVQKPYWEPTLEQIEEGAAQIKSTWTEEELVKRAPYLAIVPADTHVIAESDIRAGRRGGVKP